MTGLEGTSIGTTVVEIRLFERFGATVNGVAIPEIAWRRRSSAALVKLLALAPGHRMHREQIIDALWPDTPVDVAAPRLHKAAHYARRGLGVERSLLLVNDTVTLLPDAEVVVDVIDFCAAAERALRSGTEDQLRAALARYRGEPLPEDRYETWSDPIRSRISALHDELRATLGRHDELRATSAQASSGATGAGGPPGGRGSLRLVGRRAEGDLLRTRMARAERGDGGALIVSGPAGVGKSALLRAAAGIASRRGWYVGHGVASAIESPWDYAPVLEAVTALRGSDAVGVLRPDTSTEDRRPHAAGHRDRLGGGEETRARLFPAVDRLLRECAQRAPVLLVIDDVDDADLPSVRLLHYVARRAAGQRMLLLISHRSPTTATCAQLRDSLLSRDLADSLPIAPLAPATTHRLVADRFPALAPARVAEVVEASGGLPFAALQLGRFLSGDPTATPAPRVPRAVFRTLRVATGLGESFATVQLAAQAGIPTVVAARHLAVAETVSILERTAVGHRFRHPLLREVVAAMPVLVSDPIARPEVGATPQRGTWRASGRQACSLRRAARHTQYRRGQLAAVPRSPAAAGA